MPPRTPALAVPLFQSRASSLGDLFLGIFRPGIQFEFVRAFQVVAGLSVALFLGVTLLSDMMNLHLVVLSLLTAALLATMSWFLSELQKQHSRVVAAPTAAETGGSPDPLQRKIE